MLINISNGIPYGSKIITNINGNLLVSLICLASAPFIYFKFVFNSFSVLNLISGCMDCEIYLTGNGSSAIQTPHHPSFDIFKTKLARKYTGKQLSFLL